MLSNVPVRPRAHPLALELPNVFRYLSSALAKSAASAAISEGLEMSDKQGALPVPMPEQVPSDSAPMDGRDSGEGDIERELSPLRAGIRRLLLTGNRVGDEGALALASALRKDRSLEFLDLTRCAVSLILASPPIVTALPQLTCLKCMENAYIL